MNNIEKLEKFLDDSEINSLKALEELCEYDSVRNEEQAIIDFIYLVRRKIKTLKGE